MASHAYSFIDIVVLDRIRQRFGSGNALLLLSTQLDDVIWANGAGAALIGHADFESAIGSDPAFPASTRRQIMATSGYPQIGESRQIAVRLPMGTTNQLLFFSASQITLPNGTMAVLLALIDPTREDEQDEDAAAAISGLAGDGQVVALVDAEGAIIACSDDPASVGLDRDTRARLARQVTGTRSRLLKRMIETETDAVAVGIAHLSDSPDRFLLMAVADLAQTPARREVEPAASSAPEASPRDAVAKDQVSAPPSVETVQPSVVGDPWYFNGAAASAKSSRPSEEAVPDSPEPIASDAQPPEDAGVDLSAGPIRFVWRTDAAGRFSMVGEEFASAVGRPAADVVGQPFEDISRRFGLDPSHEIADLLRRRDTWSGRSVLWPVSGTALKVPLDLAALPAYGRDREFEGFRGFGVARLADVVPDPDAIGLALSAGRVTTHEQIQSENQTGAHEPDTDDPFRGEVPVLDITSGPERRRTDKVIRLAEHRPVTTDRGLSNVERINFREIGRKLRESGIAASGDTPAVKPQPPSHVDAEPAQSAIGETALEALSEVDQTAETARPAIDLVGIGEAAMEAASDPVWPDLEPIEQADARALPEMSPVSEEAVSSDAGDAADAPRSTEAGGDAEAEIPEASQGMLGYDASRDKEARPERLDMPPDQADAGVPDDHAAMASDHSLPSAEPKLLEPLQQPVEPEATATSRPAPDAEMQDRLTANETEAEPAIGAHPREIDPALRNVPLLSLVPAPTDNPSHANKPEAERAMEVPASAVWRPRSRAGNVFLPSAFAGLASQIAANVDTSLLSRLPLPILVHAGDDLHYANREFLQLTGHASLEELGQAGGLDAIFAEPFDDSGNGDGKLRLRRKGGDDVPVDAFLQSVAWGGGKALLLALRPASAVEQATAVPQRDGTLDAQIDELRTIIDTATDGIIIMDEDGVVRSISRPAEALFGLESAQVAGRPFESLLAIESQRSAREYLAGLAGNGVASVLNDGRDVIGREAQGRFIPLFMTIGRLPRSNGYCAVVRDVTPWKRAEEELTQARAQAERASSQKTDFLARVSHEIRTPLNAIIGFSELMVDEKFGPVTNDRYRDYLRDINRSGNHVLDLVNDLLDISKIEAGEQELNYEAVSLNDTLGETVAMMQPQANRERVIIRSSFASRLPDVVADLRSVRQIALNLFANAIRYTQAGGQVIVSTAYEPNGDVVMRVRDTGVGMTAAELEQAMKPFKQVNALKRPRGDGTGLGLPLTKAMVEANRARFSIHSTSGEGTLVEIVFPSTRVLAH